MAITPQVADITAVNSMTPVQAFRWYNEHGYLALPALPRKKQLAIPKGYHFHTLRALTEQDIRNGERHWYPGLRVALVMADSPASGLFTLDVDDREQGLAFGEEYDVPATAWQSSGREGGGWHFVYRRSPQTEHLLDKNRCWNDHYSGIEVKANGIIIASPSMHESGRQYQWRAAGLPQPAVAPVEFLASAAQPWKPTAKYRAREASILKNWIPGLKLSNGVSAGHSPVSSPSQSPPLTQTPDQPERWESARPEPVKTIGKLDAKVRAETRHHHRLSRQPRRSGGLQGGLHRDGPDRQVQRPGQCPRAVQGLLG
jgi:Bifunctional DNA primase/polymerase, N-terminal